MWENMAPIFKLGKFVMVKTFTPAIPEKIHSIICDCCKTEFTRVLEIQEFLSFSDTAGYGNRVVEDMTRWISLVLVLGLVGCGIFSVWQFLPGVFYTIPWFMWLVIGGFSGVGWLLVSTPLWRWLHRTLPVDTQ